MENEVGSTAIRRMERRCIVVDLDVQTYGLTAEQYAALLDHQGGACAICRGVRRYRLNVDHDHRTGLVRGATCRRCNRLLRDVRDDADVLRAAADYLDLPPAKVLGIEARVA